MAGKRYRGNQLKVISGKEATLNRITMLILDCSKKSLTRYDPEGKSPDYADILMLTSRAARKNIFQKAVVRR